MNSRLALTLAATVGVAFALGACGSGDRQPEDNTPVTIPQVTPSQTQSAAAQPEAGAPGTDASAGADAASGAGAVSGGATAEGAAPAGPASATVSPTERLYTVQIAAYLSADSARAMADKLSQLGFPVWTTEARVGERTYHRIRVGAYPRLSEMRRLGQQISTQFSQEVWVAPVDMAAQIPAGAVEATRALLQR